MVPRSRSRTWLRPYLARAHTWLKRLALAEGADLEIVRAAALLHDAAPMQENGPDDAQDGRPPPPAKTTT